MAEQFFLRVDRFAVDEELFPPSRKLPETQSKFFIPTWFSDSNNPIKYLINTSLNSAPLISSWTTIKINTSPKRSFNRQLSHSLYYSVLRLQKSSTTRDKSQIGFYLLVSVLLNFCWFFCTAYRIYLSLFRVFHNFARESCRRTKKCFDNQN